MRRWRPRMLQAWLVCLLATVGCGPAPAPVNPAGSTDDALRTGPGPKGDADVTVGINTAPVVRRVVTREGHIHPGETVALRVNAVDPDGDTLRYTWHDGCQGTFHGTHDARLYWTAPQLAPASGQCTIRAVVRDGKGGHNRGDLTVVIAGPVMANLAPRLQSIFQSTRVIRRHTSVVFRVQAADPEGHPLQFIWRTNGGAHTLPTHTAGQSEITWRPPDAGCQFDIILRAEDPTGLFARQRFRVKVNAPECQQP